MWLFASSAKRVGRGSRSSHAACRSHVMPHFRRSQDLGQVRPPQPARNDQRRTVANHIYGRGTEPSGQLNGRRDNAAYPDTILECYFLCRPELKTRISDCLEATPLVSFLDHPLRILRRPITTHVTLGRGRIPLCTSPDTLATIAYGRN